eukprot:scaffold8184_cov258-Pinguiococcus_pyrenoidosus.AAC.6
MEQGKKGSREHPAWKNFAEAEPNKRRDSDTLNSVMGYSAQPIGFPILIESGKGRQAFDFARSRRWGCWWGKLNWIASTLRAGRQTMWHSYAVAQASKLRRSLQEASSLLAIGKVLPDILWIMHFRPLLCESRLKP